MSASPSSAASSWANARPRPLPADIGSVGTSDAAASVVGTSAVGPWAASASPRGSSASTAFGLFPGTIICGGTAMTGTAGVGVAVDGIAGVRLVSFCSSAASDFRRVPRLSPLAVRVVDAGTATETILIGAAVTPRGFGTWSDDARTIFGAASASAVLAGFRLASSEARDASAGAIGAAGVGLVSGRVGAADRTGPAVTGAPGAAGPTGSPAGTVATAYSEFPDVGADELSAPTPTTSGSAGAVTGASARTAVVVIGIGAATVLDGFGADATEAGAASRRASDNAFAVR